MDVKEKKIAKDSFISDMKGGSATGVVIKKFLFECRGGKGACGGRGGGGSKGGGGGGAGAGSKTETVDRKELVQFGAKIKSTALESEPATTKVLKQVAKENNAEMVGLNFRIKSSSSMHRKMNKELTQNPKWSIKDLAVGDVNDILRYTVRARSTNYKKTAQDSLNRLRKDGHKVEQIKNYWGKPGYKGINVVMRNPQGTKYELQFHTRSSHRIKENVSHKLYEKIRTSNDPKMIKKWTKEMNEAWNSVKVPKTATGIG